MNLSVHCYCLNSVLDTETRHFSRCIVLANILLVCRQSGYKICVMCMVMLFWYQLIHIIIETGC